MDFYKNSPSRTGYLFIVLLLLCNGAVAQEAENKDMNELLTATLSDTSRINALIKTAKIYSGTNDNKADSLISLAILTTEQIEQFDYKVEAFEKVGHYFLQTGTYDSAVTYYSKALILDKKRNNIRALARHHDNVGSAFYYKGDYNRTLHYFTQRLSYCEQLGDSTCISAASNNSGAVLINLGRYEDAISYTLRSLKIDEILDYKPGILSSLMSLGNINFYLKNYDRAITYYLDIITTCKAMEGEELRMSYAYNNIASIYFEQKEFKKSVNFYTKSLSLEKEFGDKNGIALKYNNLGSVYKELGKWNMAKEYYRKSLTMRENLGDMYGMSSTESNLGQLYLTKDNAQMGLQWYRSALVHAKEAGSLEALKIAHEGIAKSYKVQGMYKMSLQHYELFLALNDSLLTIEKAANIQEIETRYESEKKENEIALLKKNEELNRAQFIQQNAKLRESRLQRNLLFLGVALLVILVFLIIYIYKQRLAAKEIIQKNQEETQKMRSRFFASISHEFRTPLTLISAPIMELLKKYPDEDETRWKLGLVQQNAHRLLKLINQILDLSKLEVGKLRLQVAKGDIVSWLRIISSSFKSLADSKDIVFKQYLPEKKIMLFFDKEKSERILSNLLSNAMKFTPNGGIVEFLADTDEDYLKIEVKNTGSYISTENQSRVFERFYQIDALNHPQGTGIGLALVKELTELHFGKVNVHSDRYYTTFSVKLPLNDTVYADSIKVKTVSVTDTQNSESPMRMYEGLPTNGTNPSDVPIVLLVEDNEDMRSYMSALLSNTYRVKETRNGNQALEVAVKEIPDIIITDLMMPEMNGEELLEQLRKDSKTQHIPVIMLTARTAQESKLSNLGKGADHYLTKPFDVEDLMIRIKSLLDQRKRIRDYHKSQFLTNPKAEDIVSSNDRFLQRIGHVAAKNFDDYSFTINEFATEMNMSRVQLYRKMKAIIGYSATDFIRQYRLKKASDYLKNKKGTVSEIAYEVGFNNLSYFTKCFKDVYGVTPSQYLKSDTTLKD